MREYDTDTINMINLFESKTHAHVRDCIVGEVVYFLVEPGSAGLAIGKAGENVKKLQNLLKKRVRVFEYDEDPVKLAKNMVPEAEKVEATKDRVVVTVPSSERGRVIGKGGENIKMLKEFLKRNSKIEELEVK